MYRAYTQESATSAETSFSVSFQGDTAFLSDVTFIHDAQFSRDGADLVLHAPAGTVTVEGYFAGEDLPLLVAPDGQFLSPELVQSFLSSGSRFAATDSLHDVSPVGQAGEVSGLVTIARVDGTIETLQSGMSVYQGDVIETGTVGAVNLVFIDETHFAVSQNARLAIDEYVFDPATGQGSSDFSVLKGIFVFTSGLIGRSDPDDVNIDTPMGSIGIRGTIIAGDVTTGEITVVEGAIVLRDFGGNEMTLANQFETARFEPGQGTIEHLGQITAREVGQKFDSVYVVSGELFASLEEVAAEQGGDPASRDTTSEQDSQDFPPAEEAPQSDDTTKPGTFSPTEEPPLESGDSEEETVGEEELPAEPEEMPSDDEFLPVEEGLPLLHDELETNLMQGQGSYTQNIIDLNASQQTIQEIQLATYETLSEPDEAPLPPPPLTTGDNLGDNLPPPPPPPPANYAPFHDNTLRPPADFFKSIQSDAGRTFQYDFSREYRDLDGDTLTFTLGPDSAALTAAKANSLVQSLVIDSATGIMTLTVGSGMIVGDQAFDLTVFASDGELLTPTTVNFEMMAKEGLLTGFTTDLSTVLQGSSSQLNSSGKTLFLNQTSDVDFTLQGSNNTVYLDALNDGRNLIIDASATGNVIYGGYENNDIKINNSHLTIYGGDGDDKADLRLNSVNLSSGDANLSIDLGGDDYDQTSWAKAWLAGGQAAVDALGPAAGGDHIYLGGTSGAVDFNNIGYLAGIESIRMSDSSTQTSILSWNTIFEMTDDKNVLLVMGGDGQGDQIDLGGTEGSATGDTVTIAGELYNVYQGFAGGGEQVTLLVDSDVSFV